MSTDPKFDGIPEHAHQWFDGMAIDLPIGTTLQRVEDGATRIIDMGVADGGGYYGITDPETGEESLLQPGHVGPGKMYVVQEVGKP